MNEKVTNKQTKQAIFNILEIEKAWHLVKKSQLKQVRVAYIDTGFDPNKHIGKKINLKQISLLPKGTEQNETINGTLFASILSKYCYPEDCLGPQIFALQAGTSSPLAGEAVIEAVKWALKEEVDVLSLNFCHLNFNAQLSQLLYKAAEKGMITLAPAGNFIFEEYTFPACLDTVIACSSLDPEGQPTLFTNINEHVDICTYEEDISSFMDKAALKKLHHYKDPLTHYLVNGSRPTMNLLFNTLIKNELFGSSFSLPIAVALVALAKSIQPQLNLKTLRSVFEHALTDFITYKTKRNEKKIGKLNFIEILEYCRQSDSRQSDWQQSGSRSVDKRNTGHEYNQQYFLQLKPCTSDSSHTLEGEVYDLKGNRVENINTTLRYIIYPFNRYKTKPGYYFIEDGHLALKQSRLNWNYDYLGKGEFFVKLIDTQYNILNSLTKIRKE